MMCMLDRKRHMDEDDFKGGSTYSHYIAKSTLTFSHRHYKTTTKLVTVSISGPEIYKSRGSGGDN